MRNWLKILIVVIVVYGAGISVWAQNSEPQNLGPMPDTTMSKKTMPKKTIPQTNTQDQVWADILARYRVAPIVEPDGSPQAALFQYGELARNSQAMRRLGHYIDEMTARTVTTMGRDTEMAYWANLYNALTVRMVAQYYPVRSIKKIKPDHYQAGRSRGPWKTKIIEKNGKGLSLDDIEHKILRKKFNGPMVHYMLNCASIGCPNLKPSPWQAATLKADQEQAAYDFINSARGVYVDGDRLVVSKIYRWFRKDFGGTQASVLTHLKKYSAPKQMDILSGRVKINAYHYNWALNNGALNNGALNEKASPYE